MKNYPLQTQLNEATHWLLDRIPFQPEIAVVLGSGLSGITDSMQSEADYSYKTIPHYPRVTVGGHKGMLMFTKVHEFPVVIACGRHHLYEGYTLDEITFSTRLFNQIGVKNIVLSNSAGSINPQFDPGDFMMITDQVPISPLMLTEQYYIPSASTVWDSQLSKQILERSGNLKINVYAGTYAWTTGPSYETPSEVRYLQKLGADAVGMSTVPEAIVATQIGMRVVGISCLTNYATGLSTGLLSHHEVRKTAKGMEEGLLSLISLSIGMLLTT